MPETSKAKRATTAAAPGTDGNVVGGPLGAAIRRKTAKIGVMGLGYVGLPLIRTFVAAGFQTLGFDVDEKKVKELQAGRSYIEHISSDWIGRCVSEGKLSPTADMARLAEADAILICVPTPLSPSRDPDLIYVEATAREIAAHLRPGQLIVLESTTYPGTTRDVVLPILEKSGLKLGKDFFLAFSPEREDPGNPDFAAGNIPKVVGGADAASLKLAVELYRQGMPEVVPVSTCEVAEACKILENTYRAVNIALVNELKVLFDRMGIDVWEVIEAAKTKPFGFQPFYPGPGLGGHCIPIDPFYLTWLARCHGMTTRFIELAGEINMAMPQYVVDRLTEALNARGKALKGSKVCVLGVAYKRDVDDARESPAFLLIELLQKRGVLISYNDPHIPRLPRTRHYDIPLDSTPLTAEFLAGQDCVLIVTDHSAYDYEFIVRHAPLVVDTRNAAGKVHAGREKICKA
jgi:UDP-N-acetyl-D-glucosamine dehydrogenase